MTTTIADVMSALDDLILERFKATAGGSATSPLLAFEPGTPIPDESFRVPPDGTTYSPAAALEFLSHHANTAPRVHDKFFERTGDTIDGLYRILLLGAMPADAASMELLGAVQNPAKATFEETRGSSSGIPGDRFYPTYGDPQNWYDQSVAANWTTVSINKSDQPPTPKPPLSPQLVKWRLASKEVRPLLEQRVSLEALRNITTLQSQAEPPPVPTPPTPSAVHFLRATTRLEKAKPSAVFLSEVSSSPSAAASPALVGVAGKRVAAKYDGPLLPFVVGGKAPAEQVPVTSDGFSLKVDVCLVNLRRPWLSNSLLNLRNWYVPSYEKGAFSSGQGDGDTGILPVLPIACVLVRNLSIKAQWSNQDQQQIENSTGLGSFSLLGRSYDRNSATLSVPGVQCVAWICDPLPVLPPADSPKT